MSVIKQIYRTARKPHTCCECGDQILKKEKYCYTFGAWGGEQRQFKQCLECDTIFKSVANICTKEDWSQDFLPVFGRLRRYFFSMADFNSFGKVKNIVELADRYNCCPSALQHLLK